MAEFDRPRIEYLTPVDLVREVSSGRVRIPPFQRGFRWEAADVVKLFDSILRGYPIGNLLLWRRPAIAQRLQIGELVIDAPATEAALWVVDGQQRITSLTSALVAADTAADSRFRVHLDLDTGEFHTLGLRQQAPTTWLPVSALPDTAVLLRWMRENAGWLTEAQLALADRAAKAVREYSIPTYVVTSPHEEALLEIFTRMNTTGRPLTRTEVFQALHAGMAGEPATDLRGIAAVPVELGFGALAESVALRCLLAYQGGDIFRDDFHHEFGSAEERTEAFRAVAVALREVVSFLRADAGIPHAKLLPYSYVVPVLVRFVRLYGRPEGRTSTLLRRWLWRGAVAGVHKGGISVPFARGQVQAVESATAFGAASALLAAVTGASSFTPDLTKTHFGDAMAKLNVLGMLSAEPRDFATGEPVDVISLLEQGNPLRVIVKGTGPLSATVANRAVATQSGKALQRALLAASPEVRESHFVDEAALAWLAQDEDAFLARRQAALEPAIARHVNRMAEWGARDGRTMAEIVRAA